MGNYLVIMPRFIQKAGDPYIFPLGIAYISASLKKVCDTVFTLNLNLSDVSLDQIIPKYLSENNIDVLCVGGLSPNYLQIKQLLEIAKKSNPSVITIIGGGMVSASAETIMKGIEYADIGVVNEGEIIIRELFSALENKDPLDAIKGIVFKDHEKVVRTDDRRDIEDLDDLPFPDYEGFGFDPKINDLLLLCTSRSCPFNCSFCFHSCGKTYRTRSLDNVFSEIDFLVEKYNIKTISVLDELFSNDKSRVIEFCERITPYGITWSCQLRVDKIDREMLVRLGQAGCSTVSIGIESASNRILKSMNKRLTISQIDQAIEMARNTGVNLFGNLLFGDKEDDIESFQDDLKWFEAHPDLNLGFVRTLVLPGSDLYAHAIRRGLIKDEVKYLEDGYYTINATKLDEEDYNKCLDLLDLAVLRREYCGKDMAVNWLLVREKKVYMSCECPSCGKNLRITQSNFFGLENFTCRCGQNFNLNLFHLCGDEIKNSLRAVLQHGKMVVWGMGTVGKKFATLCEPVMNENIFLVDRNPLVQGKRYGGKVVEDPSIVDFDPDYILFGTSLMGKSGMAIPNSVAIQTIKNAIETMPIKVGTMMEIDSFVFDSVRSSGKFLCKP